MTNVLIKGALSDKMPLSLCARVTAFKSFKIRKHENVATFPLCKPAVGHMRGCCVRYEKTKSSKNCKFAHFSVKQTNKLN